MKIGVLSDIHGNYYAFKRVIESAKKNEVKKLLILGDIVGYYYSPDKIMDELKNWNYDIIKGNHEDIMNGIINKTVSENDIYKKYGSGHSAAIKKLSAEQKTELLTAEQKKAVEIEGVKILMCHGSNFDPDFYLYPTDDVSVFEKCNEPEFDFVLVGHSHYPFTYRNADSTLINVGSVGQSRIQGGVANWLIINTKNKTSQPMATNYNVLPLIEEIKINDPHLPYLQDILKRNAYE